MAYQLIRVEKTQDREGRPETFVQLQYTDEETGEMIPFAKWLSPEEQATFAADETTLETDFVPAWQPLAAKAQAVERASQLTMAKAIVALVNAGMMDGDAAEQYTQDQLDALETDARAVTEETTNAVLTTRAIDATPLGGPSRVRPA